MKLDFLPFPPFQLPALSKPLHGFAVGYGILLLIVVARLLLLREHIVARLGRLTWKRNQFCRGWLITGDTGSGKTSSGINQLVHQVFQNEKKWGANSTSGIVPSNLISRAVQRRGGVGSRTRRLSRMATISLMVRPVRRARTESGAVPSCFNSASVQGEPRR